jgi:hypothetical protein
MSSSQLAFIVIYTDDTPQSGWALLPAIQV